MSPIRRSVLAAAGPALVSAASMAGSVACAAPRADLASDREVDELVARSTQAHEALMRGDWRRYRALISYTDDFTLMTPFGGKPTRGATLTDERWEEIGRFFRDGRDSTLELVQAYRTSDLVVLAVIERTHVAVGAIPAQDWALRVTLVFRKENGRWLLAHRHADGLAGGISVEQAAALARSTATS
jgi:ketosteroid isomerase-like protein